MEQEEISHTKETLRVAILTVLITIAFLIIQTFNKQYTIKNIEPLLVAISYSFVAFPMMFFILFLLFLGFYYLYYGNKRKPIHRIFYDLGMISTAFVIVIGMLLYAGLLVFDILRFKPQYFIGYFLIIVIVIGVFFGDIFFRYINKQIKNRRKKRKIVLKKKDT